MELRIGRLRQAQLGQQLSHEADEAARIVAVLHQPLRERTWCQRPAASMRQEGLLGRAREGRLAHGEQVGGQRGRNGRRHATHVGGELLAITAALDVGPATVDLEVWIRLLAVEHSSRCDAGGHGPLVAVLRAPCLGLGRSQVGLALVEMFNLARRVLRAHEAAVQTAHLITFCGRVLVLELSKGASYVGIRVAAHLRGLLSTKQAGSEPAVTIVAGPYECVSYSKVGWSQNRPRMRKEGKSTHPGADIIARVARRARTPHSCS